ncbi:IclR family transcriptional regulator [Nonomuraea basaltis]|uniref:IclR family transcriptional regulator n=1 Tax=Nonomuraea basaltis TaxID=2495887 RepID=UPI00110C5522|nr:IclR family transcriptional regulator [Nonomuraea basaltis]TMR97118.1 IclR family transcriptional regulator [Nonomuraea basaltis]
MTQHVVPQPSAQPSEVGGGVRSVKSAERTIAVLEYLSSAAQARTLREVSADLGFPRASGYALLTTLVSTGWVETDGASRYRIGIRALRAGAAYVERDDVVQRAQPMMNELNIELGETVHLARLDGAEVVYLATNISRHSLAVVSRPGRRLPSWATGLGKAILAGRPWEEVDELLPEILEPRTIHTITDRATLRAELEEIRRRGHAVDEQESTLGLRCFAVALDFGSAPNEALSCSIPVVRLSPEREEEIVAALLQARAHIIR